MALLSESFKKAKIYQPNSYLFIIVALFIYCMFLFMFNFYKYVLNQTYKLSKMPIITIEKNYILIYNLCRLCYAQINQKAL